MCIAAYRSQSFQNVLKMAASSATGVGERGKTKKKVAEKEDSRKRKWSALDEIREVHVYTCLGKVIKQDILNCTVFFSA